MISRSELKNLISQLIIRLLSLHFPDHFIIAFLCMWRQIWGTDCRTTTWTYASYSASMSCHFVFEEKVVGQHPLLCGFTRDARLKLLKLWPPFEAMEQGDLKVMRAMLLSFQSAKCVGEIHAPCTLGWSWVVFREHKNDCKLTWLFRFLGHVLQKT